MAEELFEDDGTLACLHIPADESNKRFACKAERQENFRRLAHFRKIGTPAKEIRLALGSYIGWLKYTDSINLKHTLNTFAYAQIF